MRTKRLSDLLKAEDRVAVSNITGREASTVTIASQKYCGNIVGGWALGKGGQTLDVPGRKSIPVFSTFEELIKSLPKKKLPNKIIVYSPPSAVYGEVKEIVEHGKKTVETLFIITEHVSIEVTAKITQVCSQANIDVLGCNSLGIINTYDTVRVGAVGGDSPSESFRPGSVAIISNSGNMVNTMASYLLSAGMGTSYGISTGKDLLILLPLKDLLELARNDARTKLIVTYIEPGGFYEKEAVEMLYQTKYPKPILSYVTGNLLQGSEITLGHAGAVVEARETTAAAKMKLFDEYFGIEPFNPNTKYEKSPELMKMLERGIRIKTLHHLPATAGLICDVLGIERDFRPSKPLRLNPWFADYNILEKRLTSELLLHQGVIPKPYTSQVKLLSRETLGANPPKRNMRNTSHVSSNDGRVTRIYGHSLEKAMQHGSFVEALILVWTGEQPRNFEVELLEKCLIASLTNGPGTISAQGAKLSASAGNSPNTAMIATLACVGDIHGGNGRKAVEYLIHIFRNANLRDPWNPTRNFNLQDIVNKEATRFSKQRSAAKEAGTDYSRIPCLGHPVFKDKPVNYDPREQVISNYLKEKGLRNVFLEFYHLLAHRLKESGIARNVWAVNLDACIAALVLGMSWKALKEKRITMRRVSDIAFMVFALGRVAGAGGEFLDHQDFGSPMDMRIPVSEGVVLSRPKD
jgi:succinyl-CoA synthetase alpha subunit/citrate synthase